MTLSRHVLLRRLLVVAAVASLLAATGVASAGVILTIDGRDAANLFDDPDNPGNYPTFHQPPVNFAFTFGGVAVMIDTPPTDTDFMFLGTDFGALGIGMDNVAFDASLFQIEIDVTAKAENELTHLVANLKDHDSDPFLGITVDEHQYDMALPAPGQSATLTAMLAMPGFTQGSGDGIPNYDPIGLGLFELQLQYPYNDGTGANPDPGYVPPVMALTIHEIRINMKPVPEPSTLVLAGLGMLAVGFVGRARQRSR